MNEEDLLDLIEKELSGNLARDERVRLQDYLETDPEARRLHRHIVETAGVLERVPDLGVPPGLKQRIMDSIDARRYRAHGRARADLPFWRRMFTLRVRLAYAFAIGVLVGAVVYSQMIAEGPVNGSPDRRQLYGLIAGREVGALGEADAVSVDGPGVRGEIRLLRAAGLVVVDQGLRSEKGLEVNLTFDPRVMRFEGFATPDDVDFGAVSGDGWVEVEGRGRRAYVLTILDRAALPSDLRIEVLVSGEAFYRAEFTVKPKDKR